MTDSIGHKNNQADECKQPDLKIGFEEFLEDVFGLNIRSAKTIGVMFKNPSTYFQAARTPDWKQLYTPSLRLWLGLMTIMVALQFIWARPDGTLMQMFKQAMEGGLQTGIESGSGKEVDLKGFDFDAALTAMMKLNTLIYPFIFITAMSFLALIFRAWGEKLSYVVRQRYIFAIIVPGTVIGLISTIFITFASTEAYMVISLIQIFAIIALYFITAYRGPYAHMEAGEKFGRSTFLSLSIFIILLIAQFISYTIAMFVTLLPALKAHLGAA